MNIQYDWDNLIKQLTVPTDPRLDVRIEALLQQTQPSRRTRSRGRGWLMHIPHNRIKYAAAAVFMAAGLAALMLFHEPNPPLYTINQTVEALNTVSSVQMPVTNCSMGSEILMAINPRTGRADRLRMDNPDTGDVTITIPGQTYACSREKKEVTFLPQELLAVNLNFKEIFSSIVNTQKAIGGRIDVRQAFSELAGKEVIFVDILRRNNSIAAKLLIEPKTRLPIYIGMDVGGQLSYMGPIRYNVSLRADTFEFAVPAGYTVTDMRPEDFEEKTEPHPPAEDSSKVTPYGRHGRVTFEEEE